MHADVDLFGRFVFYDEFAYYGGYCYRNFTVQGCVVNLINAFSWS